MTTRDYFDIAAGEGSEEDDESFDEETGEARRKKTNGVNGNNLDDSSEEDDEDDDEEAAAKVREGFIVEEDDDEAETERRRRKKHKRRREERQEEGLDEEDLDLIGELGPSAPTETKYKRLKRGHRPEERSKRVGIDDIFADENEDEDLGFAPATARNALAGEFDDFIEQDEPEDQDQLSEREVQVGRPRHNRGLDALNGLEAGLDEATIEDMHAAFGDNSEYAWALDAQEDEDLVEPDKPLELKDVFEPSQLVEKKLTDEDNRIRAIDIPERFQIARLPFIQEDLTDEEQDARIEEESRWISTFMWPKKSGEEFYGLQEPFRKSIASILRFMNVEQFEVPYILSQRKDYLISTEGSVKLLTQPELWQIFELDLKFRALVQKRQLLQRTYDGIKALTSRSDEVVETLLPVAMTSEEIQDIQDYVSFQYSAEIKDTMLRNADPERKRSRMTTGFFERVRAAPAYNVVRGFGISPDAYAKDLLEDNRPGYTDDPQDRPDDMADHHTDADEFPTGSHVLKSARALFAEEIAMSPRMRKFLRGRYYTDGLFDCIRTEKGLRQIDEDHQYYEFKYLRNQRVNYFATRPGLFLRMLKAESEGLVEIRLRLGNRDRLRRRLQQHIESDNLSELADAWNVLRREALDDALYKIHKIMVKGVKETLKVECENHVALMCREEYSDKLDRMPYRPKGSELGFVPRVLALTNGRGTRLNQDQIHWAWMEADGRVLEHGSFADLRLGNEEKGLPDPADIATFNELIKRRKPEVIAVSGMSPEAKTLQADLQVIVERFDHRRDWSDSETHDTGSDRIEVILVNDEVARLYHQSDRAKKESPNMMPLTRYCIALARYVQDPMKEYVALGGDVLSISFHPDQNLIPQDKLMNHLESAMVDIVNFVGVDINEAIKNEYVGNLLPYLCGLGPRKASAVLQAINRNGGQITYRTELIENSEGMVQVMSPVVFANCASSLQLMYDPAEQTSNYLDSTRIHPEDYDLAKKMVADALDLDEEDIAAEIQENGEHAIVRKLVRDGKEADVDLLDLESYAEDLASRLHQRKRATLETIRAEILDPYGELRRAFSGLSTDRIFTMLTGETSNSLYEDMVIPVSIKKIFGNHLEVKLDCGIDGWISEDVYPSGIGPSGADPREAFRPHQTVQAKLTKLERKELKATLSLREEDIKQKLRPFDRDPGGWDDAQEDADKREAHKRTEDVTGRATRVIKHPLFRPFNTEQAEEFLGPQDIGNVVIRPSSKGLDHLAVTWKVSNNVYQHIDVLELDKENEFSVGRTLKVGGRYTYSDLDELIVNHVQSMAKKVDEISHDERWNKGSKAEARKFFPSLASHTIIS